MQVVQSGSVAKVGAAALPSDGVLNIEDGACFVLAFSQPCAASSMDVKWEALNAGRKEEKQCL